MDVHPVRRLIILGLSIVILASACTPSGPAPIANITPAPDRTTITPEDTPSTDSVSITFGHFEQYRDYYEPLIDEFNAQNPDIQVLFVTLDDVWSSEDRSQAIAQRVDTMGIFSLSTEDQQQYLRNLTPLIDADPAFDREDYYPGALTPLTDGNLYALPQATIIPLLSYNQNLFEQANVPLPTNEWQWEDMRLAAEQIAVQTQTNTTTYGLLARKNGSLALQGELQAANSLLDDLPPDEVQLDDPSIRTSVQEVISMTESGALYVEQSTDRDLSRYSNLIKDGRVGMWFTGSVDGEPTFETGTVALPLPIGFGIITGYSISVGTQHPNEAWRWLTFLSRQYEPPGSGEIDAGVHMPVRRSVTEEVQRLEQLDPATREALEITLAREPSDPSALKELAYLYLPDVVYEVVYDDQSLDNALQSAQERLIEDQLAAQSTPELTPEPAAIVVATPVPDNIPSSATTITFASDVVFSADVQPLIEQFHQEQTAVFVEWDAKESATLIDLATTADCFVTWAPPTSAQQAALLDLRPLWDADADTTLSRDVFPSAVTAPFEHDGALYGLPHRMDIPTLHYNPALFDATNLPYPTADWSLEDFVAAATQLTQERDDLYGFAVLDGHTTALEWWLQRADVTQVTPELTWTESETLAALQGYVDLIASTSPHNQLTTNLNDLDLTAQLIREGQVAMWLESGSTFGAPTATIEEASVAPLPGGTRDNRADDVSVTTGLYIAADTPHTDACWRWLRYLSADATSLGGGFPARTDVTLPATEAQPAGQTEVYTIYQEALAQTTQHAEPPFFLRNPDLDPFWFYQALDRALQGANLEQELTTAQQMSEAYVTCVDAGGVGSDCAVETDPEYAGWQRQVEEE